MVMVAMSQQHLAARALDRWCSFGQLKRVDPLARLISFRLISASITLIILLNIYASRQYIHIFQLKLCPFSLSTQLLMSWASKQNVCEVVYSLCMSSSAVPNDSGRKLKFHYSTPSCNERFSKHFKRLAKQSNKQMSWNFCSQLKCKIQSIWLKLLIYLRVCLDGFNE